MSGHGKGKSSSDGRNSMKEPGSSDDKSGKKESSKTPEDRQKGELYIEFSPAMYYFCKITFTLKVIIFFFILIYFMNNVEY